MIKIKYKLTPVKKIYIKGKDFKQIACEYFDNSDKFRLLVNDKVIEIANTNSFFYILGRIAEDLIGVIHDGERSIFFWEQGLSFGLKCTLKLPNIVVSTTGTHYQEFMRTGEIVERERKCQLPVETQLFDEVVSAREFFNEFIRLIGDVLKIIEKHTPKCKDIPGYWDYYNNYLELTRMVKKLCDGVGSKNSTAGAGGENGGGDGDERGDGNDEER